jgi:hypothetical protein
VYANTSHLGELEPKNGQNPTAVRVGHAMRQGDTRALDHTKLSENQQLAEKLSERTFLRDGLMD